MRPERQRPPLTPEQRRTAESLFPIAKRHLRWAIASFPQLDPDAIESQIYFATCIAAQTHTPERGASLTSHLFNCCHNAVLALLKVRRREVGRYCQSEHALREAMAPEPPDTPDFAPLYAGLNCLNDSDRYVLVERFWANRHQGDIGRDRGVSRQRIWQQQITAMGRLRDRVDEEAVYG